MLEAMAAFNSVSSKLGAYDLFGNSRILFTVSDSLKNWASKYFFVKIDENLVPGDFVRSVWSE